MLTNSPVTIYNKSYNPSTKTYDYYRTVVPAVNWQSVNKIRLAADIARLADDSAAVYIPWTLCGAYTDPTTWDDLIDKSAKWTLREGDIVVKGSLTQELSDVFPPSLLKSTYPYVMEITSIAPWEFGTLANAHIEVGLK